MANKWIAIGDSHGRRTWKSIVEKHIDEVDRIIFVGDYFDSFNIPMLDQIRNFSEILKLKRENPDKIVLLLGNHDYHYLSIGETYSGFNSTYAMGIEHDYLKPNLDLFKICHREGEFLFSHAGFTRTWVKDLKINIDNIDSEVNDFWKYKQHVFGWRRNPAKKMSAYTDHYGDDIWQGPLWVRPNSLDADKIKGYVQVVGHTEGDKIKYKNNVYYIDALEKGYYLCKEGDKVEIKNILK
jgi:hypothetical protein